MRVEYESSAFGRVNNAQFVVSELAAICSMQAELCGQAQALEDTNGLCALWSILSTRLHGVAAGLETALNEMSKAGKQVEDEKR